MSKKIKIYCVLFDAVPLGEDIISFAQENKMNLLRQIGGCSTQFSCVKMLTGKLPSDLKKNGIGYFTGRSLIREKKKWRWEKDFITSKLLKQGWNVRYHNGHNFAKWLSNDAAIKMCNSYSQSKKPYLVQKGSEGAALLKKMINYINSIQREKIVRNTMHFMYYEHIHLAYSFYGKSKYFRAFKRAKVKIKKIMKNWDLNEPNAIFWFFADHGNWNLQPDMRHPNSQMYYSWALVKDNTKNPIKINSNFISIRDFFPTIMNKFNYEFKPFLNVNKEEIVDVFSIEEKQNEERVYYIEDARRRINKYGVTTKGVSKFVNWENNKPTGIVHISYHSADNTWDSKYTILKDDTLVGKSIDIKNIDKGLVDALKKRYKQIDMEN